MEYYAAIFFKTQYKIKIKLKNRKTNYVVLHVVTWMNFTETKMSKRSQIAKITQSMIPFFFFFFWLHHTACRIFVPQPGIEPVPPAVEVRGLNHWTAREAQCMNPFIRRFNLCEFIWNIFIIDKINLWRKVKIVVISVGGMWGGKTKPFRIWKMF